MFLLVLTVVALLVGCVAVVRGYRGRIIDDHPICRRCGFDLFGRPANVTICSECGAVVTLPNAVRIGHRQRRPAMLAGGALLLLLGAIPLGIAAWTTISRFNTLPYQPEWWLIRKAKYSEFADLTARHRALGELTRRMGTGEMKRQQLDLFLDELLALQADESAKWQTQWGDFIENADRQGFLTRERRTRYWSQGVRMHIDFRNYIRRGDRLPWVAYPHAWRLGTKSECYVWREDPKLTISGIPYRWRSARFSEVSAVWSTGGTGSWSNLHVEDMYDRLTDGPQVGEYSADLVIAEREYDKPYAEISVKVKSEFTLLPADAPLVRAMSDDSLADAMRAAMAVSATRRTNGEIRVELRTSSLPAPLYHKATFHSGDETWSWPFTWRVEPGEEVARGALAPPHVRAANDRVDVVLRPHFDPPEWLVGLKIGTDEIVNVWDGEIVFRDVPIVAEKRAGSTQQ